MCVPLNIVGNRTNLEPKSFNLVRTILQNLRHWLMDDWLDGALARVGQPQPAVLLRASMLLEQHREGLPQPNRTTVEGKECNVRIR